MEELNFLLVVESTIPLFNASKHFLLPFYGINMKVTQFHHAI